ncbi:MAG: SH3 domain-containing protein [Caldilineales bacterium]|nr:SH3 domain-containing protein [Caldilineales bacterium]
MTHVIDAPAQARYDGDNNWRIDLIHSFRPTCHSSHVFADPEPGMNTLPRTLILIALCLLLISCQAADGSGQLDASALLGQFVVTYTPTATATPAATATPEPTHTPTVIATPTTVDTPTATVAPASPTPMPLAFAQAVATGPTNLRDGPGTNYARVGGLQAGDALRIIGKNPAGDWWQLARPNGEPVWIYAPIVRAQGSLDGIEVAANIPEPPPTPVPAPASAAPAASTAPSPRPATGGSFGYGVQIQPYYGADITAAANAIKDLGFNWVKWQVLWRDIEKAPGQFDWGEQDHLVGFFSGQGINVLSSVVKAPEWARPADADLGVEGPPADPQTFANFLGAFAGHYCGRVRAIEVWNEQNLHYEWGNEPLDAARYMDLLKRSYAAIKAACPQMTVVSGALTPVGDYGNLAVDDFRYLEAMYQHGLKGVSDAIGAHPSGYNVPPNLTWQQACGFVSSENAQFMGPCDTPHHSWSARSTLEGYRNIMLKYGDGAKRIWPTEFGWAAGGAFDGNYMYANDNTYDEQARWTRDFYQMMKNWGYVGPAFLWNLNFATTNPGSQLAQWSILDQFGGPGQTYEALKWMPK